MENFNPIASLKRWMSWENFFFLAAVFVLGWVAGVMSFAIVLTKSIG